MPASTCPACGAAAFVTQADGGTCTRCGYSSGESNLCPHCGAVARVLGSGARAVCAVCGGPRIPGGFGREAAEFALREQKRHLDVARIASVSTVLQASFAAIATVIGLAIVPASLAAKVTVLALAAVPIILAIRSRSRAATAREKANEANEHAWQAAAEDAASRADTGITAATLAKTLGIEPEHADKLLTSLAVHDRTRIDVGDDAEVRYSVKPEAPVRVEDETRAGERAIGDEAEHERQGRAR